MDVLVEKRYGARERLVAGQMNLQSQWTPQDVLPEKTKGIWGGWFSAHFTWENTLIPPRSAGVTCKFTFKMKPRRILHEKTQRFLRGRREWHANLYSKWSPGAFYARKHNDFSRVGGGVYINTEQWLTFLELAHMLDATQLCLSCHCTHAGCYAGCYATVFVLSLHTCWMLHLSWGGDVDVPWTCAHAGCYATFHENLVMGLMPLFIQKYYKWFINGCGGLT